MAKQENQPSEYLKEIRKVTDPIRLNQEKIQDDKQLWARIGTNQQEELSTLASKLGITEKQLLDVLTSQALKEADTHQAPWVKRHTLDWVLLLVLMPLVAIGALIWVRGLHRWKEQEVVAASNIAPFEPIQVTKVKTQQQEHQLGAFDDTTKVLGRYSTSFIPIGSTLTASNLSSGTLPPLTDQSVVMVPIKAGTAPIPWTLPARITLLVSPHKQENGHPLILPGYLLSVQTVGDSTLAWISIDNSHLEPLTDALGSSDIFLGKAVLQ